MEKRIEYDDFQSLPYGEIKVNIEHYIHAKNGYTDEVISQLNTCGLPFKEDLTNFLDNNGFVIINSIKNNKSQFDNQIKHYYYNKEMNIVVLYTIVGVDKEEKDKGYWLSHTILYYQKHEEKVFDFLEKLDELRLPRETPLPLKYIRFLTKGNHFEITSVKLEKELDIDFNFNYNDDFNYKKIETHIINKDNGIILLDGVPGTGKSHYIKYLIHTIERPFLYIPNEYITMLTSPEFLSFALENLKDYVLILEDCENILLSRKISKSSAVPTLLNLTDGIIGDIINLTIIGTFNTSDDIDKAMFRKGRLLYEYCFKELTPDKCNLLSKKLGYNLTYDVPTTLAEIYNIDDNIEQKPSTSVGFTFNNK